MEAARLWPDQPILQFGHHAAVVAVQKELVNTVIKKSGKDVEEGKIPNECQWTKAKMVIKNKKFVQAYLLRFALPTFKQIVDLGHRRIFSERTLGVT